MKVILALHEPTVGPALVSPAFRDEVRDGGAHRLQVNLDDDHVAPAMRFGPGTAITAVVSVWSEQPLTPILDLVRRLDPAARGWSVEERVPLAGPQVPDGERVDALANVAFLRRPETMSDDEWRADWLERHTQVAIDTQATFGYVQNPVLEQVLTPGSIDGEPTVGEPVAGIVEELFAMAAMSDHHAFYGSGGDEAEFQRRFTTLMESCARFGASDGLDLVPTSRYRWEL